MKILKIKAENYRSLEDVEIEFNEFYNAISGKNNCGKSNIIKSILSFLTYDLRFFAPLSSGPINFAADYPSWKIKDKIKDSIKIVIDLELDKEDDAGVYKFINELIFKEKDKDDLQKVNLKIEAEHKADSSNTITNIFFSGVKIDDEYKREELLNRIRSSESVIFHNSTENEPFFFSQRRRDSLSSYLTAEDLESITNKKNVLETTLKKSLRKHQAEFSSLLGRLTEKYDVSLGIPNLNIDKESIEISLKEKGIEVSLEDWGSGTKNSTLILLNLMNAKRIQESTNISKRLTPIVIIEEPESFLHPSAQAEFGRILQDLAREFKIQIIVATHSPYLLSHKEPKANLLLERDLASKNKGSKLVDTAGEKWYEPFALSLGVSGEDFGPLKSTIFSDKSDIILVEGSSDKTYFELLKQDKHGKNKLNFEGEIFPYGGAGNLKNNILLKFIKERFKRFIVTIDLDKISEIRTNFASLGLTENKEYLVIGKNQTGKKCIEGLLPDEIFGNIYTENIVLVRGSMENSNEGKDARNKLKAKILEKFIEEDKKNNNEIYKDFFPLVHKLNKIFK
ncbi:ATP-dependent nuclease [Cloacibacterium normanense]|uniref:ATP-dependent nuclease n=1 Tax=Cloacibacterium normanense TaxID=237258 RepID=UPI00352DB1A0